MADWCFRNRSPDFELQFSAIPGLTAAMMESNGPFIEAKIHIRAHLISIYSSSEGSESVVSRAVSTTNRILCFLSWFQSYRLADMQKDF